MSFHAAERGTFPTRRVCGLPPRGHRPISPQGLDLLRTGSLRGVRPFVCQGFSLLVCTPLSILVWSLPCLIIAVSISDKWGIRSRCRALAKPRVHRHNRMSMTRMRVVASSLMSPDHGVQRYRLGPSSRLQRYRDSRLVMLFLWAVPMETTPLLFRDLDSQLLAFPFPSDCLCFL